MGKKPHKRIRRTTDDHRENGDSLAKRRCELENVVNYIEKDKTHNKKDGSRE